MIYLSLHDQYRDYYYTAKTHDENQAIQLEDGEVFEHANWAGEDKTTCVQV